MKKYSILVIAFVLTLGVLTGCGCTDRRNELATTPTAAPTTPVTMAPTEPATEPATLPMPTTDDASGTEGGSNATGPDGNGMTGPSDGGLDVTSPSGESNARGRRIR